MNEYDYTSYYYSNRVEKRRKEDLLDEYREVLFAHEMRDHFLAGRQFFPERAVRERLSNIEKNDPVAFDGEFKIWTDLNGWLPCVGSFTKLGAGTRAAGEVHS